MPCAFWNVKRCPIRPTSTPTKRVWPWPVWLVTQGSSKNYFVFVIPVAAELDLKAAARSVGEKSVAMIHVADINKVTGYVRGGCSPVGMKKQYKTVFDESVLAQEKVYVSGGRIGTQVCCAPADLIRAARATTAKIIF